MSESTNNAEFDRERQLTELVSAVGGVVWEFDWTAGRYTFVSESIERLLGFSVDYWMTPAFWNQRVHPEDRGWVRALSNELTEQLEDHELTYRLLHRNGSVVWVRDVIRPARLPDGRIVQRGMLFDITARKVAEQAAEQAETGFREMVEAGGRLAMKIDEVGRFTYVSSAWCELVGKSPEQLLGTPFTQLLAGEDRRRIMFAHREHMFGRDVPRSFRFNVKDGAGRVRLIELQIATLFDRNGRPNGATALGEDVTDREAIRVELERRAAEFDTAVALLRDAYVRVDPHGVIRDQKGAMSAAFIGGGESLIGRRVDSVVPVDVAVDMQAAANRANATGESCAVEYRIQTRKGPRDFEARLFALPGESTAMVMRDVTDRRKHERRLTESLEFAERLLELVDSGVLVVSADDNAIVRANAPAEALFGYGPGGLIGKPVTWLMPAMADIDGVGRGIRARIEEHDSFEGELELCRRDGTCFDGEVAIKPIDQASRQFILVVRDITQRLRNEAAEREYHERLSALSADLMSAEERERRKLAEELHDRVSQSLAVARMHLRAALDDAPPAATVVAAEAAAGQIAAALPLLDDAIQQSRAITRELSPPVLYELGIGAALQWLAESMRTSYRLSVEVTVGDDIAADEDASAFLFRSARELLVNIVKHAGVGQAWVSLEYAGGELVLTVVDQGRGLDPGASSEPSGEGGFGLFSIAERARHLGGSCEVESSAGSGTCVTITLPALRPAR